jgi:hypothetical protein
MTRPFYESDQDRSKEQQVIDVFCQQFNLTSEKQKPSLIVDYALMRGQRMVGVAEVKVHHKQYPEMFISYAKVRAMRDYMVDGIAPRVIFAMPEGIFVKKLETIAIDGWIGMGGRKDRNDAHDREPVVFYKTNEMTRIADSKKEWFV